MEAVHTKGVLMGGLAAGVVMSALDYVSNTVILGARWTAELTAINPALSTKMADPMTIAGFVIVDFHTALAIVWTYGAIRTRFGPGQLSEHACRGVGWWNDLQRVIEQSLIPLGHSMGRGGYVFNEG